MTPLPRPAPAHFLLTGSGRRVAAHGRAAEFTDPHAAAAALRSGTAPAVVGALPFDLAEPAALTVPDRLDRGPAGAPDPDPNPATVLPDLTVTGELPAPAVHLDRVARAVRLIRSGALEKVVLARALDLVADAPIDPHALAAALAARDADGESFLVDLSAAGGAYVGRTLVGSTPEVLVRRVGDRVYCHPYAGTATSPEGLLDSAKDREEHAHVVDAIADALAPMCAELDVPAAPSVFRAGPVWHLGTPIAGRLRDARTTALDLALVLHPTPAVCGMPRDAAAAAIGALEGPRGFYAGAVGWTTADGDGQWRVAIRCADLRADRMGLRAYAGGGIVAASDPVAELDETANKFRTVLGPFRLVEPATR